MDGPGEATCLQAQRRGGRRGYLRRRAASPGSTVECPTAPCPIQRGDALVRPALSGRKWKDFPHDLGAPELASGFRAHWSMLPPEPTLPGDLTRSRLSLLPGRLEPRRPGGILSLLISLNAAITPPRSWVFSPAKQPPLCAVASAASGSDWSPRPDRRPTAVYSSAGTVRPQTTQRQTCTRPSTIRRSCCVMARHVSHFRASREGFSGVTMPTGTLPGFTRSVFQRRLPQAGWYSPG